MSLQKLESSRNVTSKVISNRIKAKKSKVISNCIKAKKSKSTEQDDCKLFFRLDGRCNSQLSNYLTQRAEILTRRSNLTPQRAKNTVNDLSAYQIALKQRNQNPQNNMIASFSFASTADVTLNGRII